MANKIVLKPGWKDMFLAGFFLIVQTSFVAIMLLPFIVSVLLSSQSLAKMGLDIILLWVAQFLLNGAIFYYVTSPILMNTYTGKTE